MADIRVPRMKSSDPIAAGLAEIFRRFEAQPLPEVLATLIDQLQDAHTPTGVEGERRPFGTTSA